MPQTPNELIKWRGAAMLAATAMAWGSMFPIMKLLLARLDPFTLTLARIGLAAPVLLVILLVKEGKQAFIIRRHILRLWGLGTLGFAGFGLLLTLGLGHTQPERAATIPALMPLIAVIIAALQSRQWPRPRAFAAIILGIIGVILVVTRGSPAQLLHGAAGYGEALVLLGALCWVLYSFGAAKFPDHSGLRFTAITLTLGTFSLALIEIAAIALHIIPAPAPAALLQAAMPLAYLALIASAMGFLFWNAGLRAIGAARGVLFINLVPITAFAIALVQGHIPSLWEILGVILVISALVLNSLAAKQRL